MPTRSLQTALPESSPSILLGMLTSTSEDITVPFSSTKESKGPCTSAARDRPVPSPVWPQWGRGSPDLHLEFLTLIIKLTISFMTALI